MTELNERRARLLSLIIGEYVDTAQPVGSEHIVRRHKLGISSATVRNEMSRLEEEGYISHPHTSAGRVPSDKGYRYYVEALMHERDLPWEAQQTIRHQFHQAGREEDEWIQLSAAVLARAVENAANPVFGAEQRHKLHAGCFVQQIDCRRPVGRTPSVIGHQADALAFEDCEIVTHEHVETSQNGRDGCDRCGWCDRCDGCGWRDRCRLPARR